MDVRRVVAAVMLLGLLVSCSDDEPTTDPQEPTSSATGTPSPTPTEPVIPDEARGTDEASAKAFVRYWFEVLSRSMDDGNVGLVDDLSAKDCRSCSSLADAIAEVYADGGRFKTEGWKVQKISRAPGFADERPDFLLKTRHTRRDLIDKNGDLVDRMPTTMVSMRVVLVPHDESWQLKDLEELK